MTPEEPADRPADEAGQGKPADTGSDKEKSTAKDKTKEAGKDEAAKATGQEEDDAPSADEAAQQFRMAAPHLIASSANVFGGETSVSDGDIVARDKTVNNHYGAEFARPVIHGPFPSERLRNLVASFAEPPDYGSAVARLTEYRILVLRGAHDTGRRMASLNLLAKALGQQAQITVLDPAIEPGQIADQLKPGTGHLIVDLAATAASPLRELHIHAARQRLAETNSFLVVTVDTRTVLDDGLEELHEWHGPQPLEVVQAHLRARLESGDYSAALELAETKAYLASQPSPAEAERFSRALIEYCEGRLTAADLTEFGSHAAEQFAQQRFGDDGPSLRDKAFIIAMAVFDQSPYPLISEAADDLYLAFETKETPAELPGVPIFGAARAARLDLARAEEFDTWVRDRWGVSRECLVRFRDLTTWRIVLRHVWLNHPAVRGPMLDWLVRLGDDGRTEVRVRAAIAAGALAATDFGYVCAQLLAPWASSELARQRQLAAWALSTAVEQGAEEQVQQLLRQWADASMAKRWTVARTSSALADLLGKSALGLIRTMAQGGAQDETLTRELAAAIGDIIVGPLGSDSLATLLTWSQEGGRIRTLAHRAFVAAAGRRDRTAADVAAGPSLLRIAGTDDIAWDRHAELWRAVLNDTAAKDSKDRLTHWVVLAANEQQHGMLSQGQGPSLEGQLSRLLRDLVTTSNERARLDYLLRHLPSGSPAAATELAERLRRQLNDPSVGTIEL